MTTLNGFYQPWNLILVSFSFLRHGWKMGISTPHMTCKTNNYVSSKKWFQRSGSSIYIHKSLTLKIRGDMSINFKDIESFSMELLSTIGENALINILYRSQVEDMELFENFMKIISSTRKNSSKSFHVTSKFWFLFRRPWC